MSGFHSSHAPSSLYLTVACPGSYNLRAGLPPEPDTPESIEGDVAHWVALQMAMGIEVPVGTERRGIKVDEDMIDGARLWCNTIGQGGAHEAPIYCPDVHPDCWGTADHWEWYEELGALEVDDYKYGHVYVEVFENKQLLAYASGILRVVNAPDNAVVRFRIVQPNCYIGEHVRTWTTTAGNVRRLVKEIAEQIRIATDPNIPAMCHVGEQCEYCPARHRCNVLQMASNQLIHFSRVADSHDMSPGAMGVEMRLLDEAIDLLKARKSGLATRAEIMLKEGQRIPNWELKNCRSNLAWNDPDAAIKAGDALGVNLRKKVEPITPTQALDRKLIDKATQDKLASRPPAPQKLGFVSQFSMRKILSGECS